MHEALEQILSYVKATWRRRWYIVAVAWVVSIVGWIYVYTLPDRYQAAARVYVDTQTLLRPLLSGLTVSPGVQQQIELMTRTLVARPNLEKVARMTDLDIKAKTPEDTEKMFNELAARISIGGTREQNLYTLAYQNKDPDLAKRVVQALLTIFVESSLGKTRKDISSSQKFIEDQLKNYEQKLTAAEEAIRQFKRQHIGMMPGEGGTYYSKLSAAIQALNQAQLDMREATNRRDQLKHQLEDEEPELDAAAARAAASGSAHPEIDARIADLERKVDELRLNYTDLHPDIRAIKRTIAQLEEKKKQEPEKKPGRASSAPGKVQNPLYQQLTVAIAEADATVASLQARVTEFQRRVTELRAASDRVPQVEAEYVTLTRDYDVYRSNYAALLSRREQVIMSGEVEAKTDVVEFRVVDPPRVPLEPAWPNRPLFMSLVPLGGIVAGILVAFVVSQVRRTVDSRRELRDLVELPVLGSITRVVTSETRRRRRNGLLAYIAAFGSLVGAYGVLMTMHLVLGR